MKAPQIVSKGLHYLQIHSERLESLEPLIEPPRA